MSSALNIQWFPEIQGSIPTSTLQTQVLGVVLQQAHQLTPSEASCLGGHLHTGLCPYWNSSPSSFPLVPGATVHLRQLPLYQAKFPSQTSISRNTWITVWNRCLATLVWGQETQKPSTISGTRNPELPGREDGFSNYLSTSGVTPGHKYKLLKAE